MERAQLHERRALPRVSKATKADNARLSINFTQTVSRSHQRLAGIV